MNILFYLHQFPAFGGIETVTATLANCFAREGNKVFILSHISKKTGCEALKLDSSISTDTVPVPAHLVSLSNRRKLESVVSDNRIDVIIFQDSYAHVEANLAGLWEKVPIIVCEHNAPLEPIQRPLLQKQCLRSMVRWLIFPCRQRRNMLENRKRRVYLYAHCAFYVLLSNRYFGEFRTLTKVLDWRKLRAIPNPVSPVILNEAQQQPQFHPKEKIVLCAATLNGRKGQDLLLQAWEKISFHFPDWYLVFAGDGPDREKYKNFVCVRRLPRVRFLGYVAEMRLLYARASILAFPSRREGWGLVLHEAMSQGCVPVVFNSYSAVYDVVQDGVTGCIVPSFDIVAYADAVSRFMSSPDRLARMREEGRRRVFEFSVEKIRVSWIRLFKDISNKKTTQMKN